MQNDEIFLREIFTSNTIYGKHMARVWYEWKYRYMKISNTNFVNKINVNYGNIIYDTTL